MSYEAMFATDRRLDQVDDNALQGALVDNDAHDDCRCPHMFWDVVQVETHPVEDVEAKGVLEATPRP
jgi:hypothetical protein